MTATGTGGTELLNSSSTATRKTKTSYYYDPDIGHYHYGTLHPMKVFLYRLMVIF
jgi:hypothetical protein